MCVFFFFFFFLLLWSMSVRSAPNLKGYSAASAFIALHLTLGALEISISSRLKKTHVFSVSYS